MTMWSKKYVIYQQQAAYESLVQKGTQESFVTVHRFRLITCFYMHQSQNVFQVLQTQKKKFGKITIARYHSIIQF